MIVQCIRTLVKCNSVLFLQELLEDDSIVKIGVDTQRQALYLFNDFDVRVSSTFDLFYMARAAGYSDPMKLRTVLRYYIQMTAQINPHYPFDDENEEGLAENARGGILLFRSFSSELQPKERPYVVKNIIDTYCLPYLGFFYGIDGSIHSNTRIYFKRLKSVVTKYGTTYKLPERNKCTYCQESGSYCTYFPCKSEVNKQRRVKEKRQNTCEFGESFSDETNFHCSHIYSKISKHLR